MKPRFDSEQNHQKSNSLEGLLMKIEAPYTCMETCGQEKPCGNRYCSAHPKHFEKKKPNPKGKRYKPPDNK